VSIAEVEAALREILDTAERTSATISAVIERLSAVRDQITKITVGSSHPLVRRTLSRYGLAIDRARDGLADLGAAQTAIREYLAVLHGQPVSALRAMPPPTTTAPAGAPTQARADASGFDPAPYFAQMPRFDPDATVRQKTHGRWTDSAGTTHHLLSGRHDPYHTMVDQRAAELSLVRPNTGLARSGDIELKFAMRMRETWQRTGMAPRETIVINNPNGPCEGDLGCDALLPRFLPPGGELTVHWPGGKKTYRGEID
jgi:hypothetical protein